MCSLIRPSGNHLSIPTSSPLASTSVECVISGLCPSTANLDVQVGCGAMLNLLMLLTPLHSVTTDSSETDDMTSHKSDLESDKEYDDDDVPLRQHVERDCYK